MNKPNFRAEKPPVIDRDHPPLFQKDLFLLVMASTFLFGLAAHAYCYFNVSYSHDSLMVYQGKDNNVLISVGRFLPPLYLEFRGDFYPPWLVGMLSLAFVGLSAYLTISLLRIGDRRLQVLCCGVLAVNASLTLTNATYIKDTDVYMCAMLLAVAAVYVWARAPWGVIPAAVLLGLSLGMYQAFYQVAICLFMIFLVKRILAGEEAKKVFRMGVSAVAALLLGLAAYYIILRCVLAATGIEMISFYNSAASLEQLRSFSQLLQMIGSVYTGTWEHLREPEVVHQDLMSWLNLLLLAASAAVLILLLRARRIRGWALALLAAVLVLMPLGVNVIHLVSQDVDHTLMRFSLFYLYIFAVMLLDEYQRDVPVDKIPLRALRWVTPCVLTVFLYTSIVYANQVYLKKNLEYQATMATMIRVVDRIEQLDGYEAGKTPVAIVGLLRESPLSIPRQGLSSLDGVGLNYNFSLTYIAGYKWYFDQILGYPIALLPMPQRVEMSQRGEVLDMPVFPDPGSCAMVDGIVVIKFS